MAAVHQTFQSDGVTNKNILLSVNNDNSNCKIIVMMIITIIIMVLMVE